MKSRRDLRSAVAITASLATLFVSASALANKSGLAGYTGKPNATAPQGESCNQCHTQGTAPTVTITGPATLAAGQTADYAMVVQTAQTRAAGGIAATDGIKLTPVTNLRDSFGEMVQTAPVTVAGGQATFNFRVTAPLSGTTLRLWAVGLAANGNNNTSGDRAAHTTRDIAVTGGAPPPLDAGLPGSDASTPPASDAGDAATPGPDAGAGSSSSSGGASSSGGSSGTSGTSGTSGGDPGADDPAAMDSSDADAASCSSSGTSRTGASAGAWGVGLLALGAIARTASSRRRRRRA